jgi:hypothetical protein
MKETTQEKIEKIMNICIMEGIVSPKQLIDKEILNNYQEWARLIKVIRNKYPNYEFKQLDKDQLKFYNIRSSDERERYYLFVDKVKEKEFNSYYSSLKKFEEDKKIEIVKDIVNPSKKFTQSLRSLNATDRDDFLDEIIEVIRKNQEKLDILMEQNSIIFFTDCTRIFNLSNKTRKKLCEFTIEKFRKERDEYLLEGDKDINENNIIGWYKIYINAYLDIFLENKTEANSKEDETSGSPENKIEMDPPSLETILKWGEEDMLKLNSKIEVTEIGKKFLNFYTKLLVEHIKSIDEKTLNNQRLKLDFDNIIQNKFNSNGYKRDFYSLFLNLDNWGNWEILLKFHK